MSLGEVEHRRVRRLVHQFLSPDYDREAVIAEIVFTAWKKNLDTVSRQFVRYRCTDLYRSRQRELKGNEEAMIVNGRKKPNPGEYEEQERVRGELVSRLVLSLTPFEQSLIWAKFWNDQSLEDIAKEMSLRREDVQKAMQVAIFKMSQEVT